MNIYMTLRLFVNWAKYCNQPSYQNYWRMQGFCIDYYFTQTLKTGGNIWNIIMDFVFAFLPWAMIWRLKIVKWEKIGLCIMMSLGVLIAVMSTARTVYVENPSVKAYDDWYFCKSDT
jgi:hypothetical protein